MSNSGDFSMFTITTIANGTHRTLKFDTLQQAQDWLKACAIAYGSCTLVIDFNKGEQA
jgi:hypothetical protein